MMKWKVVKNQRSSSVERSLECLKNEPPSPQVSDSNNNSSGEPSKPDLTPAKENTRQRDSSITRKPSIVASDCINLKSFLGLTRQRSETNLSCIGLISTEPRRSRSEVRGTSCDRLTIGYHTSPTNPIENGKTRSSSPPSKSGCWLRGRKRERESRNPLKTNHEFFGKTIVTGSNSKWGNSKLRNGDARTIVDGSDSKDKTKAYSAKPSPESRKIKYSMKNSDENTIMEDDIYSEIDQDNIRTKLLEENKDAFKDPNKVIRKKGMAPKPQITTALFKESSPDVDLHPSGQNVNGDLNSHEQKTKIVKPPRKMQTFNGRNQDKKAENRNAQTVKFNNFKNAESMLLNAKNKLNSHSVIAVAEIHKDSISSNEKVTDDKSAIPDTVTKEDACGNGFNSDESSSYEEKEKTEEEQIEAPPFHIDTPDYSTLDSEVESNPESKVTEKESYSRDDFINCNAVNNQKKCDSVSEGTASLNDSEQEKPTRVNSLSSILRDSTNENRSPETEPKKTVRFEKLDLIEKYKKNKSENTMDTEDDPDVSVSENKIQTNHTLDVNSNEITSELPNILDDLPKSCEWNGFNKPGNESPSPTQKGMTVNVLVRNPSPIDHSSLDSPTEDTQTQFVVKKSFVLTIAKQEKGFKSLCANKKSDLCLDNPKNDQQISVTFLCSEPTSETWIKESHSDTLRLRSLSVPPQCYQEDNIITPFPPVRGRSRERRSKERQNCKKNHKARKKDAMFHMPQAVIDELSQVLEKRKPSLDEIPV